jgi:hypothetical protein
MYSLVMDNSVNGQEITEKIHSLFLYYRERIEIHAPNNSSINWRVFSYLAVA